MFILPIRHTKSICLCLNLHLIKICTADTGHKKWWLYNFIIEIYGKSIENRNLWKKHWKVLQQYTLIAINTTVYDMSINTIPFFLYLTHSLCSLLLLNFFPLSLLGNVFLDTLIERFKILADICQQPIKTILNRFV